MIVECRKSGGVRNTGALEQCLEALTIRTAVALPGFKFDSLADAKDKTKWEAAIAAKQLFPLYEAEELTSANTEDTVFEGRSRQYVTADGKKITTYSSFLGFCSHRALKSFDKKDMVLFEFTEAKGIIGVHQADGSITGQSVVLNIGKRLPATADRPPSTLVTINYKDSDELEENAAHFFPVDWNPIDIQGIFDVYFTQVSASATEIKFTATAGCAGGDTLLTSLESTDVELLDENGDPHVFSFVEADSNGVYTLTGTGFADGFTLSTDGVVTKVESIYESPNPLVIQVSTPSV